MVAPFAPDSVQGGAHVMRQLLRDYPRDSLAWWCLAPIPVASGFVPAERIHGRSLPARWVAHQRLRGLKNTLAELGWVPSAAADLRACLARWAPRDVVFLAHDWVIPVFARVWSEPAARLHVVVHDFMDHAAYVSSRGGRRARRFMREVGRLYAGAASRTVISEEMADELCRTTGRAADLVAPCGVEPDDVQRLKTRNASPVRGEIRVAYPGTVTAPETMGRLVAALEGARRALTRPLRLDFYGGEDPRRYGWFRAEWMTCAGVLTDAELAGRMQASDFGLCVMNDDLSNPRYDRYSFPCKFTACLAAGLPVIAAGHAEGSLLRMMNRYPVGLALAGGAQETWAARLTAFLARPEPDAACRAAMTQAVEGLFNAERNRRAFQDLLMR